MNDDLLAELTAAARKQTAFNDAHVLLRVDQLLNATPTEMHHAVCYVEPKRR